MKAHSVVSRRNATYFFTFHTISDRNTACKEVRRKERARAPSLRRMPDHGHDTASSSAPCNTRLLSRRRTRQVCHSSQQVQSRSTRVFTPEFNVSPRHSQTKGKGFPYSILSVGPGADPGVQAQAISLQVTVSHPPGGRLPLLSARPAVTSPAAEHHRPLAGTSLTFLTRLIFRIVSVLAPTI